RECGNRPLDRGVADAAGGRDALAEPDDAREGIDHAKAVARRTGDQEPAIVGAEVERGIDLAWRSRRRLHACRERTRGRACSLQVFARHQPIAKPRVIVHSNFLSAAITGRLGIRFSLQTLAALKGCATTPHRTMPNPPLWAARPCYI